MAAIGNIANTQTQTNTTGLTNKMNSMDSSDFINLMITQLKNQDPTKPMTNQELLAQVTQIGTLQSQTELQSTLTDITLQNQISSATGMIGKKVTGLADDNAEVNGVVTSVKVVDKGVSLQLDDGSTLKLDRVTNVEQMPDAATTAAATSSNSMLGGLKSLVGL